MKRLKMFFAICVILSSVTLSQPMGSVSFQTGPAMNTNRMGQFSMVLPNGNVVLLGGHGTSFVSLNTAEIYSPTLNTFTQYTMQYIHDFGAVSDLSDGTWLIAGGSNDLGVAPGINGAEIFNPSDNSFTACSSLVYNRCVSTGVRLANDNVLIVGGWYDQTSATYGEIFHPSTKSFTATQALQSPRSNALAIATTDSGAVIVGGYYYYGGTYYENVEYYNSTANSFTQLQNHLFPSDSGWYIQNDLFLRPLSSQRMKNGDYLICAWKSVSSDTVQYTLGTFNPVTKSFAKMDLSASLPSTVDSIQFFRAPILDTTKNVAYWFGIKTNSNPWIMQLYTIDLTNKTWQAGQFDTTKYYWTSAGMSLLHNGNILISGGTTSNDYYTNFTPVDSTLMVSIGSLTGVMNNQASLPSHFNLSQNYPNPFNPTTTISFSLPTKSFVSLKVFDILGRDVATIFSGELPAGTCTRQWNAANMASGVYYYRLQAGSYSETKKFVLLK
jgi:Secretion system C-terminal sorting domain